MVWKDIHAIASDNAVFRYKSSGFGDRLGRQHMIERITVKRERRQRGQMGAFDRKPLEPFDLDPLIDLFDTASSFLARTLTRIPKSETTLTST